jgi:hypothetical protein
MAKLTRQDLMVFSILARRVEKLVDTHNARVADRFTGEREQYLKDRRARAEKLIRRLGKNIPIKINNVGCPELALTEEMQKEIAGKEPNRKHTYVDFYMLPDRYGHSIRLDVYGDATKFQKLAKEMEDALLKGDTSGLGAILDSFDPTTK